MFETLSLWVEDNFEIYLMMSFVLGILGMLILSYRAGSYKYENKKKHKSSTFKESSASVLTITREFYKESKLKLIGICIVLSLIGIVFLTASLLPRIFIKRWLS